MGKENYSLLNDISSREWRKYKFVEKSYRKQDNRLFQIATEGHSQELSQMFITVIECTQISKHDRKLAKNIWERYDITGELSFSDLQIVDGLYSAIVSEQCANVMDNVNTDNTLENIISSETDIEGK